MLLLLANRVRAPSASTRVLHQRKLKYEEEEEVVCHVPMSASHHDGRGERTDGKENNPCEVSIQELLIDRECECCSCKCWGESLRQDYGHLQDTIDSGKRVG